MRIRNRRYILSPNKRWSRSKCSGTNIPLHDSTESGDKVYWITGYGTGGSIANIIADRLIDDAGAERVYCYTFGARGVINIDAIDDEEVIDNMQNYSIFNLRNIDDISLIDIGDKWFLYGRDVTFSLSGDSKSKQLYNKMVSGESYGLSKRGIFEFLLSIFNNEDQDIVMQQRNKEITSNIVAYIASTLKEKNTKKMTALDFIKSGQKFDISKISIENAVDIRKVISRNRRYPRELLSVIENVGNWYIGNIPTYMTSEQAKTTQTQRDNSNLNRAWGEINLYNYTDLRSEAENYVNAEIENMQNNYMEEYHTEDLPTDNLSEYLYTAGDDCVRFGMAVYNYITEGKLIDLHNLILENQNVNNRRTKYFNYGQTVLVRNADTFVSSDYEIDEWFDTLGYYRIDVNQDFQLEDLKPGDFLCCSGGTSHGHVEFYLGYNYNEEIIDPYSNLKEYTRSNRIEIENQTDYSGGKAEGTFGWGAVSDKIPSYSRITQNGTTHDYNWYFYKSADGNTIYRCNGYHKCVANLRSNNRYRFRDLRTNNEFSRECCCDTRSYDVIYRMKGY